MLCNNDKGLMLFPQTRTQMSQYQMIIHYSAVAIGTGVLKLGSSFNCGFVLAMIINTFFAVTTYFSLELMVECCAATKTATTSEVVAVGISERFSLPFSFVNSAPMLICSVFYIQFIQGSVADIIASYNVSVGFWDDPLLIAIYLFVLIIGPSLVFRNVKHIFVLSLFKFICILFLMVVVIYYFTQFYFDSGFDPNKQLETFKFDSTTISCILTFATSYLIQPVAVPGIDSLKLGTKKSINQMFLNTIIFVYLIYTVFGLFEYFTLFDSNTGELITTYYPNNWMRQTANILLCLMMCVSVVLVINAPKQVIIKSIAPGKKKIELTTWFFVGFCIYVSSFILTIANDIIQTILSFCLDLTAPLSLYLYPSILYFLVCKKERSLLLTIFAIINIVVTVVILVLIMRNYFFS